MKRTLSLALLLCVLLPAVAMAFELPVITDDKVDFSHMSIEELHILNDLLDHEIESRTSQSLKLKAAGSDDAEEIYVWVADGGKRYHANSECSGMTSPTRITLEEAASRKLKPCSRCDPPELDD